ncbi:MBL fold metallo-hydrolase [Celerinatantimonas sp. YJH-8]|uniref:MBL fold metallo-hydrolase n=1 Tax=Celerinatantimonas sp. YJH-8 TaxID=3228714 RepID=UPI0038C0E4E2
MQVKTFYDTNTATFTHVVIDEATQSCAIIDSVLDYDPYSGHWSTTHADDVIHFVKQHYLQCQWILETHVHADHITAAHYLKENLGGEIAMGSAIVKVLKFWVPIFDNEADTPISGEQYDRLFDEGETFLIGSLPVTVWHTPGHTPACASYLIDDAIFVGDTLFAPHLGTARCDFPGGSAAQLYHTIQRFYTLDDHTRVFLGHDYPQEGEQPIWMTTIAQAKQDNTQIKPDTPIDEYIRMRETRDATLAVPKLLLPSIQANMRNGQFGARAKNGHQFIKIPVNFI